MLFLKKLFLEYINCVKLQGSGLSFLHKPAYVIICIGKASFFLGEGLETARHNQLIEYNMYTAGYDHSLQ